MYGNILTTILLLVLTLQAHGSENPSKTLMSGDGVPMHYWTDACDKYSGLNLSTLDYAAKYDAQQLAYQARYDSLGIHLNSHEPAISQNAGYVQNSILPEPIEEQETVSILEEAIGEETAQEEILQEQDDINEERYKL